MPYIITNGKVHLAKNAENRYITTDKIHLAQMYEDKQKALNRLKNMPNTLKNLHFEVKWLKTKLPQKPTPSCAFQAAAAPSKNEALPVLRDYIDSFRAAAGQLAGKEQEYRTELSRIDREIVDIEHKAEFEKLNAHEGYELYRLLREACIRRRKCKDNLLAINILHGASVDEVLDGTVCSRLDGLNKRTYTPRELPELFTSASRAY